MCKNFDQRRRQTAPARRQTAPKQLLAFSPRGKAHRWHKRRPSGIGGQPAAPATKPKGNKPMMRQPKSWVPRWGGGVAGWQPEKAQVAKQFCGVVGQAYWSLEPVTQVRALPELSHGLASIPKFPFSLHSPTSPNNIGMPFFAVPPITIPIIVSVHRCQQAAIGSPLTTTRICDIVACPYFKHAACANFWGAADKQYQVAYYVAAVGVSCGSCDAFYCFAFVYYYSFATLLTARFYILDVMY